MMPQSKKFLLLGILFLQVFSSSIVTAGRKDSSKRFPKAYDLEAQASENEPSYAAAAAAAIPSEASSASNKQPESRQDYASSIEASSQAYSGPTQIFMARPVTYVPPQVTFNPPRLLYANPSITHASDSTLVSVPDSKQQQQTSNLSGYSTPSDDPPQKQNLQESLPPAPKSLYNMHLMQYQSQATQTESPSHKQTQWIPMQYHPSASSKPSSASSSTPSQPQMQYLQYLPSQATKTTPAPQPQPQSPLQMQMVQYKPSHPQTTPAPATPASPPHMQMFQYQASPTQAPLALVSTTKSPTAAPKTVAPGSWSKIDVQATPPGAYTPPAAVSYSAPPAPAISYHPASPPSNVAQPAYPTTPAPANSTIGLEDVLSVLSKYVMTTSAQWSQSFADQLKEMNKAREENKSYFSYYSTPAASGTSAPPAIHPGWTMPPPGWGQPPPTQAPAPPPVVYSAPPTAAPTSAPQVVLYQPAASSQVPMVAPAPQHYAYPMPMDMTQMTMMQALLNQMHQQQQQQQQTTYTARAPKSYSTPAPPTTPPAPVDIYPDKSVNEVETEYTFECEDKKKKK